MALFPRINSPCPLSADEQKAVDGRCARCDKHVHALNEMNSAQCAELLAAASGPLCVSYKVSAAQALRMSGVGFAMAATLVAGAAVAADAPVYPANEAGSEKLEFIIITGGVDDPTDAAWIDDSDLPELPVLVETAIPSSASNKPSPATKTRR